MSVYTDCDVNIHGYSSNVIAGDQIIHTHGSRPAGFEQLQKQVAPNALHNSGEVSDQPKCHPGTRVAILDHLIAWATAITYVYPIIWLHGPAGAGKFAIQRTVAQLLSERGLLLASFFFFRTAAGRNSHHNFIATMAYQLTLSMPATRPHIEQATERDPLIFSLSLWDQAQALILFPILAVLDEPSFDASRCPRIAIIDGLDECHDPKKQCEILDVLCRILQNLPIPIALLIASRPEHHIRSAFDLGDLNSRSSRLSLDDSYNPDADIKQFLLDRFNGIRETHPFRAYLPTFWPLRGVIDKLVHKASGQFIFASTVDRFISSIRHNPAERLDILLGNLDAGMSNPFEQLDSLYSTIFHSIDPVDLAGTLRLLGATIVLSLHEPRTLFIPPIPTPPDDGLASPSDDEPPFPHFKNFYSEMISNPRPYSPRFLERLLGLGSGDVRRLLFDLESLLTIDNDDKDIRFFHASLSDYLFDKPRSGQFWIDAGMVYADVVQQCLSRLALEPEDWTALRRFCSYELDLFFSKAAPTLGLRDAINNFDMTKVVSSYGLSHDPRPTLLYGIRHSKFSDAEQLYRAQLALYAKAVRVKIQVYFEDPPARYAFITLIVSDETLVYRRHLTHLFGLSREVLDNDRRHGFKFLSRFVDSSSLAFRTPLKDLLEDPEGEYFIDDNQYADVALHMVKYMSDDPRPDLDFDTLVEIQNTMAVIFPIILSKSSLQHDLVECVKSTSLGPSYLKKTSIRDAVTNYISMSEAKNKPNSLGHDNPERHLSQNHVKANQALNPSTNDELGARHTPIAEKPRVGTRISNSGFHERTGPETGLRGESGTKTSQTSKSKDVSIPAPGTRTSVNGSRSPHILASRTGITVPPNQATSSNIAGSRNPKAATARQRADPVSLIRPPNNKKANNIAGSRNPGFITPLQRRSPIPSQGQGTQKFPQHQDEEIKASGSNEGSVIPVPTHDSAALVITSVNQKPGDPLITSSKGIRTTRPKKIDAPKTTQKPSWRG